MTTLRAAAHAEGDVATVLPRETHLRAHLARLLPPAPACGCHMPHRTAAPRQALLRHRGFAMAIFWKSTISLHAHKHLS